MARIQTPQHVQELQAEFKIREAFGMELLETVQPVFSLGAQKVASLGYPRKCIAHISITAGVGENSECIITCPANRGIVINVDEVWITSLDGAFAFFMTDGVAPASIAATSVAKAFRDGRIIDQLPDAIIQSATPLTAAPNGRQIASATDPAGETTKYAIDFILGGGAYLLVRQTVANLGFTTAFLWTEFLLEDR